MNAANWRNRDRIGAALRDCLDHGHEWTSPPCPVTARRWCRRPGCTAMLPGLPEAWDRRQWMDRLLTEPFDDTRPR